MRIRFYEARTFQYLHRQGSDIMPSKLGALVLSQREMTSGALRKQRRRKAQRDFFSGGHPPPLGRAALFFWEEPDTDPLCDTQQGALMSSSLSLRSYQPCLHKYSLVADVWARRTKPLHRRIDHKQQRKQMNIYKQNILLLLITIGIFASNHTLAMQHQAAPCATL